MWRFLWLETSTCQPVPWPLSAGPQVASASAQACLSARLQCKAICPSHTAGAVLSCEALHRPPSWHKRIHRSVGNVPGIFSTLLLQLSYSFIVDIFWPFGKRQLLCRYFTLVVLLFLFCWHIFWPFLKWQLLCRFTVAVLLFYYCWHIFWQFGKWQLLLRFCFIVAVLLIIVGISSVPLESENCYVFVFVLFLLFSNCWHVSWLSG